MLCCRGSMVMTKEALLETLMYIAAYTNREGLVLTQVTLLKPTDVKEPLPDSFVSPYGTIEIIYKENP